MDLGADFVCFAALLIVSGAVAGVLAGLFGIGGGTVLVPILYQGFAAAGVDDSVRMHLAIGTSLAVIVPTSIRSFVEHRRRGSADTALLRDWLIVMPAGAVAGTFLASIISGAALRAVFAALTAAFALRFIIGLRQRPVDAALPGQPQRGIIGAAIGLLSSLMGIGGGVLNNAFMTLYGRSMLQAVATSAGVGVLLSVPGALAYVVGGWGNADLPAYSAGYVSLIAVALLVPTTVLAAPLGVRLAHRLGRRQLELAFGLFLLVVAARFGLSLL